MCTRLRVLARLTNYFCDNRNRHQMKNVRCMLSLTLYFDFTPIAMVVTRTKTALTCIYRMRPSSYTLRYLTYCLLVRHPTRSRSIPRDLG